MFQFKSTRWILALGSILLLLGLGGCAALPGAMGSSAAQGSANVNGVGEVTRVSTVSQVESSGVIQANQVVNLSWKTTGQVAQVAVKEGDWVKAGTLLMTLDPTSAPANVLSARAELLSAQEALDTLLQPTAQTVANARKALAEAHTGLDSAQSALKSEISSARSAVEDEEYDSVANAADDLAEAQDALPLASAGLATQAYYQAARAADQALRTYQQAQADADAHPQSADLKQTLAQSEAAYQGTLAVKQARQASVDDDSAGLVDDLVAARGDYDAAVADYLAALEGSKAYEYSLKLSAAQARYLAAEETLDQSQTALFELLVTPDPQDVAAAQARVQSAQATVNMLAISAPFDGEVLAVNVQPGDMVSSEKIAVVVANRFPLKVEASIDESEIAAIQAGNPVKVTLDAVPERTLSGIVVYVNPVGQTSAGVVRYTVEVALDQSDMPALLGATADVTIQTGEPVDRLAVPLAAVQADATGEFVNVVRSNGATERVAVESGDLQAGLVIVSGNLQPGDTVQLVQKSSSVNLPMFGGDR